MRIKYAMTSTKNRNNSAIADCKPEPAMEDMHSRNNRHTAIMMESIITMMESIITLYKRGRT